MTNRSKFKALVLREDQGKIAAAAFFAANMLPPISAAHAIVETMDTDLMGLPESAF